MPQKTFRATTEHLALVERAAAKLKLSVDAYLRHVMIPHAARVLDEPKPDMSPYPETKPKDPIADAARTVGLSANKVREVLGLLATQLQPPEPQPAARPAKRRTKR